MTAVINKSALTISYFYGGTLLTRHHISEQQDKAIQLQFDLSKGEKLMGAGERVLGMDRRGHKLPLYNRAHYGYTTFSEQMNYSLPAVMSDKKYVLLFDNSAKGWLDLGKSEQNTLQFSAVGGRNAFIVIAATGYPKLVEHYVDVTGKQPMPARWFLGNHASRFGYKDQQQVLDTIKRYRQLDIPVDSIILDLYWFGKDVQGHMGNLQWDQQTFPQPELMIEQLAQQGVKTTLITEPFVLKQAKRHQEAKQANALALDAAGSGVKYYDFYFGHTALVDVFSQTGQKWFSQVYKELFEQGVTGVWGDLGEPEVHPEDMRHQLTDFDLIASADEVHNAYGHQWAKLVYQTLKQQDEQMRPFILMRSGFAGSQRYGIIPWTGDVSRSWGGLKPQVELSLQMGLFGLAYTHSDLGGFAGDTYDKEMYIRWLQYGVFQPIYRPHAQDKVPSEPVYHDRETQDILRQYIKLRYALLPYNYTLAYENSTSGMPLMRPMFFTAPNDSSAIDEKQQFMWGSSFLVKPVTEPNARSVKVSLPEGNWFNFWTDEVYQGEQSIDFAVDLTTIPVLVKAGSFIPTVKPVPSTADYSSEELTLTYYYDPEVTASHGVMYEDDGHSASAIADKNYELLTFSSDLELENKRLVIKLNRQRNNGYSGMPEKRAVNLVIKNWPQAAVNAKVMGKRLPAQQASYDQMRRELTLSLQWLQDDTELTLDF